MVGLLAYDRITRMNWSFEPLVLIPLTVLVSYMTYRSVTVAVVFGGLMVVYEGIRLGAPRLLPEGQA